MYMKKLIFPMLLWLAVGCSKETPEPPVQNKYLVRTETATTVTKEMLQFVLGSQGYGQYAALLQSNVRTLRVVYATEYPKGNRIHVSGALLISENYNPRFPVVVLNHSTYENRHEAPSREIENVSSLGMEVFLGMAIASAFNGALLMPDYVGYAESQAITHPYMHGESLGQVGLDFVRAFREYAADPAVALPFNPEVFIAGYSEGGYAAVALHKAIDALPERELTVYKNVAGSGAYDLEAFSKAVMSNPQPLGLRVVASYLWTIGMYKHDFHYAKAYADIFSEADDALLRSIGYDLAYYSIETAGLPVHEMVAELFHPAFIAGILDDTDTDFLRISRANSLVDFAPKDSLIFVWGDADNWVYPVNSENAFEAMHNKGCKVASFVQPGGDHMTTQNLFIEVLLGRLLATDRELR
jgi:hypothetical protein